MPRQISQTVCAQAVIDGISEAQNNYALWSGGEWLWAAAEYMLTVHVAKALAELEGANFVTIEHNGHDALNNAGAVAPGPKPKNARLNGRFDLLLWWGGGTPRAVIELKNQPICMNTCTKDFNRISSVLSIGQENSSLQFGLFGFYTSAKDGSRKGAEEKVQDKINTITGLATNCIGSRCKINAYQSDITTDDTDSAWAAGCLLIKPL